ncbi:MAG: hypothetical protein GXP03_02405 [Alphaproteobacteria bacterium]|nr:hypothetical protein [Alphaproteobacteria bacterium]
MSQEWMIDVLTDLKNFASANGLMGLAEQLDDSILVAAAELKLDGLQAASGQNYAKQDCGVHRALAAGDNI